MAESTIKQVENFLGFCVERHKVISRNIANIGTDNYIREEVSFANTLNGQLNSNLKTSSGKHIIPGKSSSQINNNFDVKRSDESEALSGVNNVDIETEMSLLAENTLLYKFASRKVSSYYRTIQNVVKGGQK